MSSKKWVKFNKNSGWESSRRKIWMPTSSKRSSRTSLGWNISMTLSSCLKWKTVRLSSLQISSKNSLEDHSDLSWYTDLMSSTQPTSTLTLIRRKTCLPLSSSKTARSSAALLRAPSTQASLPITERASSSALQTKKCIRCVNSPKFQSITIMISTTSSWEMQRSVWSRNRKRCSATSPFPTLPSITQEGPSPSFWRWMKRPLRWLIARYRSRLTSFMS